MMCTRCSIIRRSKVAGERAGCCVVMQRVVGSGAKTLCNLKLNVPPFLPPLARSCSRQTSDDEGAHVSFVVNTRVEATQEAWDSPRRYREFTQLRKRLLRLGIDIPTSAGAGGAGAKNGDAGGGEGGGLAPDLPKKTWRTNKFDEEHLETRRAALEAYLRAAVKVGGTSTFPVSRSGSGVGSDER